MSGILALFDRAGRAGRVSRSGELETEARAMLSRLAHRGPDGTGVLASGDAVLGQATFVTTDEELAERPPLTRTIAGRTLSIVADARLDEREDLAARLGISSSVPDGELILRAYDRWSTACASRLVGDFAFVIWDADRGRLYAARDHLGVRHLYYRDDGVVVRCATEMQALFADRGAPRVVSSRSSHLFLAYRYAEQDETLWEGIRALPSGSWRMADPGGARLERYWTPGSKRPFVGRTPEERAEQMRATLSEAVRQRMRGSGPIVADLSGGIDSSAVVSLAASLVREGRVTRSLAATSLRFPGLACDEPAFSDAVARRWDLALATPSPLEDLDLCRPSVASPRWTGDTYFHPTVASKDLVFQAAVDRGARVSLTGVGSDQLMHRTGSECAVLLDRGEIRQAIGEARAGRSTLGALRELGLRVAPPGIVDRLSRGRWRARSVAPFPWLSREGRDVVVAHDDAVRARLARSSLDAVSARIADGLLHGSDLGLGLARIDRHAARWPIEERHPFLDLRVVELLLAMPCEERYARGLKKPVVRRALRDDLPAIVRDRTGSADFDPYLRAGFLVPHAGEIRALLLDSELERRGLVAPGVIPALARSLPSSTVAPFHLANLVGLELWLRHVQHT